MYTPYLARDPRIINMPGILERLLESEDDEILFALAENSALPDFPPEAIARLLESPAAQIVTKREDIDWTDARLAPYVNLFSDVIRMRVAAHTDISPVAADLLSRDKDVHVRITLAHNEAIRGFPEVVKRLSQERNRRVRSALAQNPAIADYPDAIRRLAKDAEIFFVYLDGQNDLPWDHPLLADYRVLRDLRQNDYRDVQTLDLPQHKEAARLLAHYPDIRVGKALATNPTIIHLPDLIEKSLQERNWAFCYGLAQHPALAQIPWAAQKLAKDTSVNIRAELASNPALVDLPDVTQALAQDQYEVRQALAKNPAISRLPEVARDLAKDASIFFGVLVKRDDLPWEHPALAPYAILRHENYHEIINSPNLYKCPEAILLLAQHPDANIRIAIASSQTIADFPRVVDTLASDKFSQVRGSLASNPVLEKYPKIAMKLALERHYQILERLASNPAIGHLGDVALEIIGSSRNWAVRKLASNPAIVNLPDKVAQQLANQDWTVHVELASNPAIAHFPEVVRRLAELSDWAVRRNLAANPSFALFPIGVIRDLLNDGDAFWNAIFKRDDLPWDRQPFTSYAILRSQSLPREIAGRSDLRKYPRVALLLAKHPDENVRRALAANPIIRKIPDVTQLLSKDKAILVRLAVAQNIVSQQAEEDSGWIEIKTINGRRYRYLRWREGGKKRSRYLGKATEA